MSLRDRGLRRYEGPRTNPATRWLVIVRHTARRALRDRAVRMLLLVSLVVFCAWAFVIWKNQAGTLLGGLAKIEGSEATSDQLKGLVPLDLMMYRYVDASYGTWLTTLLLALYAGTRAIVDEATTGAMAFYLARPVTRDGYLAGKLLGILVVVGGPMLAGTVVLLGGAIAVTGSAGLSDNLEVMGRAMLMALVEVLSMVAPAVALSATLKRRAMAQSAFAALVVLPAMVARIVSQSTRSPWPLLASLPALQESLAMALLRQTPAPDATILPAWAAAAMLGAIIVGAIAWLRLRVMRLERSAG